MVHALEFIDDSDNSVLKQMLDAECADGSKALALKQLSEIRE